MLSVVIPAHNEESALGETVRRLHQELVREAIDHEIVVVNDGSTDRTAEVLRDLASESAAIKCVYNPPPHGFGFAVRRGLGHFSGDAVAVFMADNSDLPADLVRFYRTLIDKDVDCVFGTRFARGSTVIDYPRLKLLLNRMANAFINVIFGLGYNDITNAFKLYRRYVIDGLQPLLSHHFNLTVELPLKAIVRGYSYAVVPNSWINRKSGESKLKIKEMGSRYLFIVLYCFIEKWLSRGDYHRARPRQKPDMEADGAESGKGGAASTGLD